MVSVVFKREFLNLFRSKGQRIGFAIMAILIIAAGIVGKIIMTNSDSDSSAEEPPRITIGITEDFTSLTPAFEQAQFTVEAIPSSEAPDAWLKASVEQEAQAESGDDVIYLALGLAADADTGNAGADRAEDGTPTLSVADQAVIYTSESQRASMGSGQLTAGVKQILTLATASTLTQHGLSAEQTQILANAMNTEVVYVATEDLNAIERNPLGYASGIVASMLLFFAVILGMSVISQGVVEEKASRVVEILVSTVPPRKLLLGKMLGIGCFVLIEVVLLLICALISVRILGVPLNFSIGSLAVWSLAWVILGFFIYATLVGAIAATVSRSEDLGAVQTPIIFLMLIPFYLGIYLVPFLPDELYTKILSWVPGFSSFMMPMRQALDEYQWWEPWLALVLAIATIPALAALAGRIYQNSILRMGQRVKLRDAFKG
ncbi:MAG: ABC transporter permease [Actinomycetaceae bacterium]|nr:ABC transporter permease [Arcanobacterium sp.]MDD7505598.1 ABC transporter permease [Actinomycetaceae bacterium]